MRIILLLCCALFFTGLQAQELRPGGLQGNRTLVISAEGIIKKPVGKIKELGYRPLKNEEFDLEIAPELPADVNWIAGFNLPLGNSTTNLFFYDSWVGTSKKILTNARKRRLGNDITNEISSNAYHIALQREFMVENETYLLVVSPVRQTVKIKLPKSIFKTERVLTYEMDAWEAKFIHLVVPPEEYTVVMWSEEPVRKVINLKENWEFAFREKREGGTAEDWFANHPFRERTESISQVSVPHVFDYTSHFDQRNYRDTLEITEMYARGTGWYRHVFRADESWESKHVSVNFLGANTRADVWLNGEYLRKHENGYTGFHHGITDQLQTGENELLVRVDNRYNPAYLPHTADYNAQGGIYREVFLKVHDKAFVKDVFVTTPDVSPVSATVNAAITARNMGNTSTAYQAIINLVNPYNEIAASEIRYLTLPADGEKQTFQVAFSELDDPQLWEPGHPAMYRVVVTLKNEAGQTIDQSSYPFGIRSFSFDKDKGFFLNDQSLKLHGVNVHQDNFKQGWAVDSASRRQDYILMKEMGVNFIRMAHYPHHPHALHLADSLGMMVWEEIPVVNSVGREPFVKNVEKTTQEMVLRDRNHPSVIMWGVGNEYYREYLTDEVISWSLKSTKAAVAAVKQYDTTRPTVMAQNDLKDGKAMSLTDLQGRNKYIGWYTGGSAYAGLTKPEEFPISMQQDREAHPEWKMIVSEYGAEGKYGYHVEEEARFDHSETYQLRFHKAYWQFIEKTDWIAGSTLWNMFDFTSFAKIGNIPHINQKGVMTYHRKPKTLYYYYQSQWTDTPMVYLVSHTYRNRYGNLAEKQPIEVYSNADQVELFVDGQSQGVLTDQEEWIWQVQVSPGYHQLKAVAIKDGEVVSDRLKVHFTNGKRKSKGKQGSDSD